MGLPWDKKKKGTRLWYTPQVDSFDSVEGLYRISTLTANESGKFILQVMAAKAEGNVHSVTDLCVVPSLTKFYIEQRYVKHNDHIYLQGWNVKNIIIAGEIRPVGALEYVGDLLAEK